MSNSPSIPLPTVGVKGSDVFSSSGDPRLDLSVKCVRGADPTALRAALDSVLALNTQEALEDAFVLAFHSRNIRGGKGERDVFYHLYCALMIKQERLAADLLDLVPHYGCWRDLLAMADLVAKNYFSLNSIKIQSTIVEFYANTLYKESKLEKPATLAAKWAPRR